MIDKFTLYSSTLQTRNHFEEELRGGSIKAPPPMAPFKMAQAVDEFLPIIIKAPGMVGEDNIHLHYKSVSRLFPTSSFEF